MAFRYLAIVLTLLLPRLLAAEEAATRLCEPWQSAYQGDDAKGKHVIALWQFEPGEKAEDASGQGRTAALRGVKINPNGRFALLSRFPAGPWKTKSTTP